MTATTTYAESVAADREAWIRSPDPAGWTIADLHALPDDGLRYELIDGSLIVSPSATTGHNLIAELIAHIVRAASPTREWTVTCDQSTTVDRHNEPRPDIVVARAKHLFRTPFPISDTLLVAEVVSPTSGIRDVETKRALYARAGVPAYWIIMLDTEKGTISLAELRLNGKTYRYATDFTTAVFTTDHPWPVTIDLPALSAELAEFLDVAEPLDA